MSQTASVTRIYLTLAPLKEGRIEEAYGEIEGEVVVIKDGTSRITLAKVEGSLWHRTKWAAQNYACQLRDARLRVLREETDRLERMTFGMLR